MVSGVAAISLLLLFTQSGLVGARRVNKQNNSRSLAAYDMPALHTEEEGHDGGGPDFGEAGHHGFLLPGLVMPKKAKFGIRNKVDLASVIGAWQRYAALDNNEYTIIQEDAGPLFRFEGHWLSSAFGHNVMKVYDMMQNEIFQVRHTHHAWNPFQMRWSFRVCPSRTGCQSDEDVLFTINRDWFGRGLRWSKGEWRIYRGLERDGNMAYYCVGSYFGWDHHCYHSREEYDQDSTRKHSIAHLEQKSQMGVFRYAVKPWASVLDHGDAWIRVNDNEDSALLIVFGMLVDMINDMNSRSADPYKVWFQTRGSLQQSAANLSITDATGKMKDKFLPSCRDVAPETYPGNCHAATTEGACYSLQSSTEIDGEDVEISWGCWSEGTPDSVKNNANCKAQPWNYKFSTGDDSFATGTKEGIFTGACLFDHEVPEIVPCPDVATSPGGCAPGVALGACYTDEPGVHWMCWEEKPTEATIANCDHTDLPSGQGFYKGSCYWDPSLAETE